MRTRNFREQEKWKHRAKRWNIYHGLSVELHKNHRAQAWFSRRTFWSSQPSEFFCSTYAPLTLLWYFVKLAHFVGQLHWCDQTCCSCYTCTEEKRKWKGNAWSAKPIQERKQIEMAHCL